MSAMSQGQFSLHRDRRHFVSGIAALAALSSSSPLKAFAQTTAPSQATQHLCSPLNFGARGDGQTLDTAAIQQAIDHCAQSGGGTVVLSPGHTFLSGTLTLKPHVEFHLAQGATLLASPNRDHFRELGSLLFAKDAEDLHISGTGLIDGNFAAFFPPKGPDGYPVPQPFLGPYDPLYPPSNLNPKDGRPRMILLVNCRRTLLEHFTIRNSPTWTIHPIGCDGLDIQGINILNDLDVPNCDGIDIDHCRNVRISNCNIVAGDDCLILKASRNFGGYGPCEGITITNCTLESSSAGIKIETEGPYPLRSAIISNCSVVRSNRGISFLNRDGATVEDLLFTDMVIETKMRPMMWWGSGEPIALSSVPRQAGGPAGLVRNIAFTNILCRGESGIYLRGSKDAPLRDIQLNNVHLTIDKTTTYPGGFYDMRPGDTFAPTGLDHRDTAGLFAANVDGLSLRGIGITWGQQRQPYFGSALELHNCQEVLLEDATGAAAQPGKAPAIFNNVSFAKPIDSNRRSIGPITH